MGGHLIVTADGAMIDLSRNRRILVVDDDAGVRALLVVYLRRQGFDVTDARNGREALAGMRAGGVDLVLLDLMMPEVSGMEVLRERATVPFLQQIPVIVVSAKFKCEQILDKLVSAVISKPFDLETLLTTVKACLKHADLPRPALAA